MIACPGEILVAWIGFHFHFLPGLPAACGAGQLAFDIDVHALAAGAYLGIAAKAVYDAECPWRYTACWGIAAVIEVDSGIGIILAEDKSYAGMQTAFYTPAGMLVCSPGIRIIGICHAVSAGLVWRFAHLDSAVAALALHRRPVHPLPAGRQLLERSTGYALIFRRRGRGGALLAGQCLFIITSASQTRSSFLPCIRAVIETEE